MFYGLSKEVEVEGIVRENKEIMETMMINAVDLYKHYIQHNQFDSKIKRELTIVSS